MEEGCERGARLWDLPSVLTPRICNHTRAENLYCQLVDSQNQEFAVGFPFGTQDWVAG